VASSADPGASTSLALVAGEVSGDLLAARLMAGLAPQLPGARFTGLGGPRMLEQGLVSDVPMDTLTVRGLLPVLLRYRELKGIQERLRDRLLAEKPDAFIGADYPGFNLGLEEQLRAAGIPTVHFIGPQIWAWRGGRIKQIQRAVSHMLVIFPFEQEIYEQAGVPVTYIGHPLAETIPLQPDVGAARRALGMPEDAQGGHRDAGQPHVRAEVPDRAIPAHGPVAGEARSLDPLHRADGGRAADGVFQGAGQQGRPAGRAAATGRRPVARLHRRGRRRAGRHPARRHWKWHYSRSRW
jgi:hypothetical protein